MKRNLMTNAYVLSASFFFPRKKKTNNRWGQYSGESMNCQGDRAREKTS
jgi:hypothetical protein